LIKSETKTADKTHKLGSMNVHLLRSKELNEETYRNVLQLLRQFQGPLSFLESEHETEPTETTPFTIPDKDVFVKKDDSPLYFEESSISNFIAPKQPEFPLNTEVATWNDLWNRCREYRVSNDIGDSEHVILLTNVRNDMNWFAASDRHGLNHFVHTDDWPYYFGTEVDVRFPIAYECIISILHQQMFRDYRQVLRTIHEKPRGCISDFCQQKDEIIIKMRTADICSDCMKLIQDNNVPRPILRQGFEILDGIRSSLTFRNRSSFLNQPSRIEIRGHVKRLFLIDLGNLEVRLNPKERSVYLLFLNHHNGINLNDLDHYRAELSEYYSRLSNQPTQESIKVALNRLLDPLDNNLNEVISRIKRKFKEAVGTELLDHYVIQGQRNEPRIIKLDRDLVSWKE
jgi:hypothetical protein